MPDWAAEIVVMMLAPLHLSPTSPGRRKFPDHEEFTARAAGRATGGSGLVRAVVAADAGVHRAAQVLADQRVGLGDATERAADRLSDRDPGAFGVVGEAPGATADPGGARQLGEEPVAFGTRPVGPLRTALRLQVVDLARAGG